MIYAKSRGIIINYLVCNNRDTLLWLANLGCIEIYLGLVEQRTMMPVAKE